jgi:hypothetical protein
LFLETIFTCGDGINKLISEERTPDTTIDLGNPIRVVNESSRLDMRNEVSLIWGFLEI